MAATLLGLTQALGLMKNLIAVLLLTASTQGFASGKCPATKDTLPGSWSLTSDEGFFEEFTLSAESNSRRFDSWLHHRPEISGASWSLENCELVMNPQNGEMSPLRFKVVTLMKGRLQLQDTSDQTVSTYRRLPSEP